MSWLRAPGPDDDKRSMGVLGVITGSDRYPGAAVLGVEAAWRTGVGTVRLHAPRRVQDLVLARRPETVCVDLDEAPAAVDAWLLGSGQDARERSPRLRALLHQALASATSAVVDAGALDLVRPRPALTVVTPHAAELARMLRGIGHDADAEAVRADPEGAASAVAAATGAIVLLKGATTLVVAPGEPAIAVAAVTHRLAVAGSGDVLAGILGAALAASGPDRPAAAVARLVAEGVRLHGLAAALAAEGDVPIAALDVAARLSEAQRS